MSQEDLIVNYYRELDSRAHLDVCDECREELVRLSRVLNAVVPIEVPEPDETYEAQVWNRLSWRLRGERRKSTSWVMKYAAIAATIAIAFIAGLLVTKRNQPAPVKQIASVKAPRDVEPVSQRAGDTTQQQRDRILLVVVGDHFDESERVLVELTNLTPKGEVDIATEQKRAEELLASNRLYRRTAVDRGEENVATLL
ncbi:MAG TPA: hypothetical protein VF846_17780, partial [Thermoanaerobaculia bacterium]